MDDWITRQLLIKLTSNATCTWSELSIDGVANNLQGYYMDKLKGRGLIAKTGNTWGLTDKGKIYADKLSLETGRPTQQPKVCIDLLLRKDDRILLYKWTRAPLKGSYSLPFGRMHAEMSIKAALLHELADKCGMNYKDPSYRQLATIHAQTPYVSELHLVFEIDRPDLVRYSSNKGECIPVDTDKLNDIPMLDAHRTVLGSALKAINNAN